MEVLPIYVPYSLLVSSFVFVFVFVSLLLTNALYNCTYVVIAS
jgi:hypothetical protein